MKQEIPVAPGKILRARLRLGGLHVVLLQLAVQSGLSDAEHARRGKLVASRLTESAKYGAPLQFLERQDLIFFWNSFGGWVLKIGRQICDGEDRPGPQSDGALDGVFQFTHVARPVVSDQEAHGVFGDSA